MMVEMMGLEPTTPESTVKRLEWPRTCGTDDAVLDHLSVRLGVSSGTYRVLTKA
jgi:hypothetical protein